jgi:uncharacterized protein involved in type VI secretion and phage assembly
VNIERVVAGLVEQVERRFYGKYRGIVVENADPARLGRLKVRVPSVLGDVVTGWATPCSPYGGAANQGFLFIPEVAAAVWVEFEEGDIEFPIWVGAPWSRPDAESQLPKPQKDDGEEEADVQDPPTRKTIKTLKGHTIQLEDADDEEVVLVREGVQGHLILLHKDGVTVEEANGNSIEMTADGTTVTDANDNSIAMTADGVTITDANGNTIEMTGDAMTVTAVVPFTIDASGQPVTIVGDTIDLQKG